MPRLRELDARFLRRHVDDTGVYHNTDATIDTADGVMFLCPKCYATNAGPVGTHSVICWFEGRVPDDASPGPGRWTPAGTGLHNLTFVPGKIHTAVSVLLTSGCGWHGFVRDGSAD
jgi:hypothetical protein